MYTPWYPPSVVPVRLMLPASATPTVLIETPCARAAVVEDLQPVAGAGVGTLDRDRAGPAPVPVVLIDDPE